MHCDCTNKCTDIFSGQVHDSQGSFTSRMGQLTTVDSVVVTQNEHLQNDNQDNSSQQTDHHSYADLEYLGHRAIAQYHNPGEGYYAQPGTQHYSNNNNESSPLSTSSSSYIYAAAPHPAYLANMVAANEASAGVHLMDTSTSIESSAETNSSANSWEVVPLQHHNDSYEYVTDDAQHHESTTLLVENSFRKRDVDSHDEEDGKRTNGVVDPDDEDSRISVGGSGSNSSSQALSPATPLSLCNGGLSTPGMMESGGGGSAKKRGCFPKNATNKLKHWLFQNLTVSFCLTNKIALDFGSY